MPVKKTNNQYTLYSLHLIPILILVGVYVVVTATSYSLISKQDLGAILGKKTESSSDGKSNGSGKSSTNTTNDSTQGSDENTTDNENTKKNEQKSSAGGSGQVNKPDNMPNNVDSPSKKDETLENPGKSGAKVIDEIIKNEVTENNVEVVAILENVADDVDELEETSDETEEIIDEIEGESKIKTFLLGADYKNLGQLRSQMIQVNNTIRKMNKVMNKVEDEESKVMLQEQINTMTQEQTRLNTIITENEDQFSLLGWARKLILGYEDTDDSLTDTTDSEDGSHTTLPDEDSETTVPSGSEPEESLE